MKIKIVLIIYSLGKGGAERIFSVLANNLNNSKFKVSLIVFCRPKNVYEIENKNVDVICLNEPRSIKAIFKLVPLIIRLNPNLVLTTIAQVNVLVGLTIPIIKLFKSLRNTKFILRESAIPSINNKYSKYPSFFLEFLIRYSYVNFDKIIAQGSNMKKDLVENMKLKKISIEVINNPVVAFDHLYKTYIPDTRILKIITVGNLRKEKGYDRLFAILAKVKNYIDFEYSILGNGSQLEYLKKLALNYDISENIHFMGSQIDVGRFLFQSDVFIQGSYYEGFPNALIEANSLGVPVIAFNVPGGTEEIIINGINGILIPDGDNSSFTEALINFRNFKFDNDEIKNLTNQRFNIKLIISKYEQLFFKLNVESN